MALAWPRFCWRPRSGYWLRLVRSGTSGLLPEQERRNDPGRDHHRRCQVANRGDRPIQVGSHYHFFETNGALDFDRNKARGMRLDIASGTAVRFEPGQEREVTLVAYGGERRVFGFQGKIMGEL